MELTGMVTTREEFLYPDSLCGRLPEELQITMAGNGRPGIQLILETSGKKVNFFLKGKGFCGEWYEMKDIPVNTIPETEFPREALWCWKHRQESNRIM